MIKSKFLCKSHKFFTYSCAKIKNEKSCMVLNFLKGYSSLIEKKYLPYDKRHFIYNKNRLLSDVTNKINEKKSDEQYDSDDDNDRLILNDDDEKEIHIENKREASNITNINKNIDNIENIKSDMAHSNNVNDSNQKKQMKNKGKYDSDVIIMYNHFSQLPEKFLSSKLSEEEIEHINTGIYNPDFDNYINNIVMKKKKQ
ncbi:conserved Plasmodium protein, unknown function [Plasmodium sp. gorilla clade G2]|uniref:conserved Plasmodium protein, unknown function n=1 Tax=Plasmodium sp. gorilla clade G2 TaxID=880535 RepID=UPI000D21A0AD|nr:conserved Plasmodium protein, unknown function [Plasmodium sp. gorilla clade G2]SOV18696.1 conserved Plasmodium protein, unknown function [Plasmodium sp. gorilla clade G2]